MRDGDLLLDEAVGHAAKSVPMGGVYRLVVGLLGIAVAGTTFALTAKKLKEREVTR